MNPAVAIVLVALVSLALGSFLNVVIARLPRGRSVVRPGSRCPACGKAVRWHDNIPLLGFLLLNGRCRDCGKPISWRYPVVEAVTALSVMALLAVHGFTDRFAAFAVLVLFLIPIAFIDLDTGYIPDKLVLPAFIFGIFFLLAFNIENWKDAGLGFISGGAVLLVFMALGKWWFKRDSMGMGDVKLLAVIGVYVGFPEVLISLFLGGIVAVMVIAVGMASKKIRLRTTIPFGPFIAIGTLTYLLGGNRLIEWYLNLYR